MAGLIIVHKESAEVLNCDVSHIGPFDSHDEAYDYLCTMPPVRKGGHKYITELVAPIKRRGA